jgi:hypothetical protein
VFPAAPYRHTSQIIPDGQALRQPRGSQPLAKVSGRRPSNLFLRWCRRSVPVHLHGGIKPCFFDRDDIGLAGDFENAGHLFLPFVKVESPLRIAFLGPPWLSTAIRSGLSIPDWAHSFPHGNEVTRVDLRQFHPRLCGTCEGSAQRGRPTRLCGMESAHARVQRPCPTVAGARGRS